MTDQDTTLLDRRKALKLSRANIRKQLGGDDSPLSESQISRIETRAGKTTDEEHQIVSDAIEALAVVENPS